MLKRKKMKIELENRLIIYKFLILRTKVKKLIKCLIQIKLKNILKNAKVYLKIKKKIIQKTKKLCINQCIINLKNQLMKFNNNIIFQIIRI